MMVTDAENSDALVYALDHDDNDEDTQLCTTAVQDGGASAVLGSLLHVKRFLRYLLVNGYNLDVLEVYECNKGFKYGKSATEVTDLSVLLPVVLGGRKMKILAYIIGGSAPLLFGRPIPERLGLAVDYASKTMKWPDQDWQQMPTGSRGEHLLNLVEDFSLLLADTDFDEVLLPADFEAHVNVKKNLGYKTLLQDNPVFAAVDVADNALCNAVGKDDLTDGDLDGHVGNSSLEAASKQGHGKGIGASSFTPPVRFSDLVEVASGGEDNTQATTTANHDNRHNTLTATTAKHDNRRNAPANHDSHNNRATATADDSVFAVLSSDVGYIVRSLPKGKLTTFSHEATKIAKNIKGMLGQAATVPSVGQRTVWEVFAGKGRATSRTSMAFASQITWLRACSC